MACAGTLKRCYEFDPVHSPSYHSNAKRRRCMPTILESSPPPAKTCRSPVLPHCETTDRLTSEKIRASIVQEVKRLQRCQQLHHPSAQSAPCNPRVMSSTECMQEKPLGSTVNSNLPGHSPQVFKSTSISIVSPNHKKDMGVFTLHQVSQLCERILHDREETIKEEYEKILRNKLTEQYEAFLKFNHDQLHRQFGRSEISYVS